MLAQLHLDSIRNTTSRKGVRVALGKLGKGSDAYDIAYNDAMARIKGQLPCLEDLALRTLLWITYAKRPLKTIELRHALGVEPETTEFDEDNLPSLEDMVSNCCGLVTVDEERDVIRLVHYTTQEYFERTRALWFPDAQSQILWTCITYLSFDVFESGACSSFSDYQQRLSTYPLYDYASMNWGHHARLDTDYQRCCAGFLTQISKVQACIQVLLDPPDTDRPRMTGLHLAAFFGLYEAVKSIIESEDLDLPGFGGVKAMQYAIREGHLNVVELLLERGVMADSRVFDESLLSVAAAAGHKTIVQLLLDKGADVNLENTRGRLPSQTALSVAARNGHEAIVRLLLERGAWINFQVGGLKSSPLHIAVRYNQEGIVRLLVENGVEVNSRDILGGTPLTVAIEEGNNMAIVRLLLEYGADAKCWAGDKRSPLIWAIEHGNQSIARMLLENGADIEDNEEEDGHTRLSRAASW